MKKHIKKYLRNLSLSKDFDVEISDGNTTPLSVPFHLIQFIPHGVIWKE